MDNPADVRELQTRMGLTLTEDMTQAQRRAVSGESLPTVAYGRVGERLADEVFQIKTMYGNTHDKYERIYGKKRRSNANTGGADETAQAPRDAASSVDSVRHLGEEVKGKSSLKGTEMTKDRLELLKENETLRRRVEFWRGQTKRTTPGEVDPKAVKRTAKELAEQGKRLYKMNGSNCRQTRRELENGEGQYGVHGGGSQ